MTIPKSITCKGKRRRGAARRDLDSRKDPEDGERDPDPVKGPETPWAVRCALLSGTDNNKSQSNFLNQFAQYHLTSRRRKNIGYTHT